jgi:hypothetical protein
MKQPSKETRMKKFIITGAALVALAAPSVAMADAPNGDYTTTLKDGAQSANASSIGQQSSAISQNGQFVSGNGKSNPLNIPDQTTEPGSRAALVQDALNH